MRKDAQARILRILLPCQHQPGVGHVVERDGPDACGAAGAVGGVEHRDAEAGLAPKQAGVDVGGHLDVRRDARLMEAALQEGGLAGELLPLVNDDGVLLKTAEGGGILVRHAVVRRDEHAEGDAVQLQNVQVGVVAQAEVHREDDVQPVAAELVDQLAPVHAHGGELHKRQTLREIVERDLHDLVELLLLQNADVQPSHQAVFRLAHQRDHPVELLAQLRQLGGQQRARRGEGDRVVVAVEQRDAQLVFQRDDPAAQRRLADKDLIRRLCKAQRPRHRSEIFQLLERHCDSTPYIYSFIS